ncbi:hypothetical protein Tco_0268021 [Tanacetum coccineum]
MSVENVSSGLVPQGQKASDYDNSDPVPPRQNVVPTAKKTDSSQQGLEFLFSPLLEEYCNPTPGQVEENNNNQARCISKQTTACRRSLKCVCSHSRWYCCTEENIKEAWLILHGSDAMQDELHQFDRLKTSGTRVVGIVLMYQLPPVARFEAVGFLLPKRPHVFSFFQMD